MKNALLPRFIVIILTVALAALIVSVLPLRLGIDLAGGTSLLYELDLSKVLKPGEDNAALTAQVVDILRKRVDPLGQKNLIWRVVGGKRIQIQIPHPDKATIAAREELRQAIEDLQNTSLKQSEILSAINRNGPDREAEITRLAPVGTDRNAKLQALAKANDELKAADAEEAKYTDFSKIPTAVIARKVAAAAAFDAAKDALEKTNVDIAKLQSTLASADNPKNATAVTELTTIATDHPSQKTQIDRVIAAHRALFTLNGGGGVDDIAELQRLITAAGVLDFRITVAPTELSPDDFRSAKQSLVERGPQRAVEANNTHLLWFQIDTNSVSSFLDPGRFITEEWAGQKYVLMYDDQDHALTHNRKPDWTVKAGNPSAPDGVPSLPFQLDTVGGSYMGDLTTANINRPMGILLDNKAITAPNIQSRIGSDGQITFGAGAVEAGMKEAKDLKQIMDAGSLPATLQHEPISIVDITSDMGADNVNAGVHSAYYAVIAVVIFMLLYYTITGFFADVALMINLLLVLATMAFLGATFTLPGIAGLVLTLGMAVDANVLINERIREELHKGASLWMAVKQGYDKVFWTIFDANLTTSLTSIVLIFVGSEEVKGFGVTLLIGLCIHMFTALFVTRTFMMAAIRMGLMRAIDDHSIAEYIREIVTFTWLRNGHWPFMRVITVTKIDWIGKRYYFWGVSAIITIAGIVAFVARGEDKYDIEFRGGTQVTFQFKQLPPGHEGEYLTIEKIRHRLDHMADVNKDYEDLHSARVYGINNSNPPRYEMQTTITDTEQHKIKAKFLEDLANEFKDVLDITQKVGFADPKFVTTKDIAGLMQRGMIVPLTAGTLDQSFKNKPIAGIPNYDVTDFKGGVAIVLDGINPPATAANLTSRIADARLALSNIPNRKFEIIPLTAIADPTATSPATAATVPAVEKDARPLTRAVMVSIDPAQPYEEKSASIWQDRVAASELTVVQTAAQSESLFKGVTSFDASVASQAKMQALTAIIISLVLIVAYVWVRFGGIRYGLGAILSLAHDAVVALAATVLAKYIFETSIGPKLLITDFKINLTMIAAYLTVIGYSVNDTIVIFDRVRELRGKGNAPLSPKLVNDAINQCFGRTIWTTFTVFIVVLIMYIWGGEGVRGFSFAMLIGVFTGAYSTLAIASPMLLATSSKADKTGGLATVNPFRSQPVPDDEFEGEPETDSDE